ncbi:Golgin subfamily A member 7/ERF4 family-domain-containing protein [Cytidiella melzeri]|nr:Golgin subfamily A member 7/ERF4 family-domain-containing protein [Cytidiella melzeri]
MTAVPSTSLHVQTPPLGDIKPSTISPPSPLTPASTISTMASVLLRGTSHRSDGAASPSSLTEDDEVIDISSPDIPHRDIVHEEATPHQQERAFADHSDVRENGPSSAALLGLQCAAPVILPPSPPLTVVDPREGADPEPSMSAAVAASGSVQQPQNVAVSQTHMQEEDITNWRTSIRGGEETRRDVLEEETEGDLEGEYDPYDLGYSPVTPVSPSGLGGGRTGEASRTLAIRQTSDHPLRHNASVPDPLPWEAIDPPEARSRVANQTDKGFSVRRQPPRRPQIPHSAYYSGPPPLDSAFHTDPIGQIGLHHPREIIRVERDYEGGELVQFSSTYPLELDGRITPTQFLETINTINERMISAHSLRWSCFDNALSFFTLQLSRVFVTSHYDRMRRLQKSLDELNTTLYNPVGLNILWPRNVAFMFLEIEYY